MPVGASGGTAGLTDHEPAPSRRIRNYSGEKSGSGKFQRSNSTSLIRLHRSWRRRCDSKSFLGGTRT
jgi:hypothetical protein